MPMAHTMLNRKSVFGVRSVTCMYIYIYSYIYTFHEQTTRFKSQLKSQLTGTQHIAMAIFISMTWHGVVWCGQTPQHAVPPHTTHHTPHTAQHTTHNTHHTHNQETHINNIHIHLSYSRKIFWGQKTGVLVAR